MKKIIIAGTGAASAELTSYVGHHNNMVSENDKFEIAGYLEYDYNIENYWKKYKLEAPVLGDIDHYIPQQGEELLVGISDLKFRWKVIEILLNKGAKFTNFIHHSVIIPPNLNIGFGNIIYPNTIIGPNAIIGNFNLMTAYSFISHDCEIGDNNFLSTAGLAGKVKMGSHNFFGIRATVIPEVVIGNNNQIQAGMVVDKNITDDSVVFYRFKEQVIAIPKK